MAEPTTLTAQAAVDAHHNHLWDVVALLDSAYDRIQDAAPTMAEDEATFDAAQIACRLVRMAMERVQAAAEAFANIQPESRT